MNIKYEYNKSNKRFYILILIAVILIFVAIALGSCSVVSIKNDQYKKTTQKIPQERELSFKSKEALAAGATLNSLKANQVYYEGVEAKSESAKILLDLSYRFLGLVGVNMQFDPSDPESVKKVFEEADRALEEKDKIIHDLKEDVKEQQRQVAENKLKREKAEKEALTWLGRLKKTVYGFVGLVIFVFLTLLIIQAITGIPVLTGLLGGIRTFWKVSRQTVKGVQEIREKLKKQAKNDPNAQDMLEEIDKTLDKHHDQHVKMAIKKMKNGK